MQADSSFIERLLQHRANTWKDIVYTRGVGWPAGNELAEITAADVGPQTFWAVRFGVVVDQFGIQWDINCENGQ